MNVAKTGAGLVGFALTGIQYTDPRTTSALDFINGNWDTAMTDPNGSPYYNIGDFYAMYAVMKGMKSYELKGEDTTWIANHDWYDEYAQWEIENQNGDGSWEGPDNPYGPVIDTAFGVLILLPQVFAIGPAAVAQASPTVVQVDESVTFDHSSSFHRDLSKNIILYEWDFNGDGTFDWSTSNQSETYAHTYLNSGSFTATLRVSDNDGLIDTDIVIVTVSGGECGTCKGKVTELTLRYNGTSDAYIEVEQKKEGAVFAGDVASGATFTFAGKDKKGTLGTEIKIYVAGTRNTKIHTSCSKPIGPGLISGDFEVIEGHSREAGLLCSVDQ